MSTAAVTPDETPEDDYSGMSDADFMNQVGAEMGKALPTPAVEDVQVRPDLSGMTLEDRLDAAALAAETAAADPEEDDGDTAEDEAEDGVEDTAAKADPKAKTLKEDAAVAEVDHTTPKQTAAAKGEDPAATAPGEDAPVAEQAPDYEELYKQVMKPFKANGQDFTPSSPDEVIRLMQMGANYTKKMQGMKPHLKMLRMLEKNELLDEAKLTFLIDLEKKDPKAIQKLLHEGKIDPLDLDLDSAPAYTPGNHTVSDAEMDLQEAISSVKDTPTGLDTIRLIDSQWDTASKQAVAKEPILLRHINEQRSNGLYDRIASEVERRRVLGELSGVPFIQAYKTVGDALHAEGKLFPEGGSAQASPAPVAPNKDRQPVDTRTARKGKPAASGTQVRGVAPAPGSTTAPKTAKPSFNPLEMSDEEIMAVPVKF